MGKRAEVFFAEAIQQSSTYEVIAQNLQLIHEKQTLGEFDFFLKEKSTQQLIHTELVYKFYVYDPKFENELDRWIGPNRKDTLLKKVEHLKSHQFPLLFREESKDLLQQQEINLQQIKQQVCFLANLFVPKKLFNLSFDGVNNACISGYWLHKHDFTEAEYGNFQFYSPKKADWPLQPKHHQDWKSYTEILKNVNNLLQHKKSAFIWLKKDSLTFERFFVVWW